MTNVEALRALADGTARMSEVVEYLDRRDLEMLLCFLAGYSPLGVVSAARGELSHHEEVWA